MKTDHYGQVMINPDGSPMREDVITGPAKAPRTGSPSLNAALLGVQRIMGEHEDDRFAEQHHMVALAEELEKVKQARDEARRAAERWRDYMRSGMVTQSNPTSLIFDWENVTVDATPPLTSQY